MVMMPWQRTLRDIMVLLLCGLAIGTVLRMGGILPALRWHSTASPAAPRDLIAPRPAGDVTSLSPALAQPVDVPVSLVPLIGDGDAARDSLRRSVQNSDNMLSGKEMAQVKKSDDGAVRQILADLARREVDLNRERTSVFARSVIDFIGGATNLMDNPDRNAAFVVLKTARVPSILLELGYVTNAEDAQQLRSDQWRDRVSSSLVTAIDTYFTQLPM